MRTHQRNLMLVITILTIISFIFFYSVTDPKRMGTDVVAQMYDRNISRSDFEHNMRKFNLALALGLTDYASQLSGSNEQGAAEFALNSMIVEHEGRRLGIKPTDDEIKNAIAAMPVFQKGGQFDPQQYAKISQIALNPQGLSQVDLDNLVANSLIFDRIKQLLDSAPAVTEAEVNYLSRVFQPVSGVAVVFERAEFAKSAKITDAQIEDYFKTNAARFVTPEYRTARYVRFPLPDGTDKLDAKAKIEAQQKVANASDAFATQAATEGFDKAAAAGGLKVETTLPFDRSGDSKTIVGAGGMTMTGPPQGVAPVVFTLSEKSPVSGVVQSGNEFVVAELGQITPSRPMTLAEVRPQIVQQLTDSAAQAALDKAAQEAIASLRAALKSGKPFAEAATAAGLKTVPFSNLSLTDESAPGDLRKYADSAMAVDENEISGFRREPNGGFAVWLEKRLPLDQKKFDEHREDMISGILQQRQLVLWHDWLDHAAKESGLRFAGDDRG